MIAKFLVRIERKVILVLFALVFATFAHSSQDDGASPIVQKPDEVDTILEKLTLEQKVGQLLILGYSGAEYKTQLKSLIEKYQPGAVIAFKRNIKTFSQVALLNRQAQAASLKNTKLPLLIMVDQEGGVVARIKTNPPLPSALAMGKTESPELLSELGQGLGQLLLSLGFNMNLAPVLDLSDPSKKSFIGNRAFGSDPELVGSLASALSSGMSTVGVIPTAKHFPGHGGLNQDSHKVTPMKLQNSEELEHSDLVPFKTFFEISTPTSVMVAHVAYPNIDPEALPAAFSHALVHDLLREQMKYQGLVITDDIEMLGAKAAGTAEERTIKAIEAGCDMVMVAWSPSRQKRAFDGLLDAVKSGRISEDRLNQSVRRIIKTKLALKDPLKAPTSPKMASVRLAAITRRIAEHNFKRSTSGILNPIPPLSDKRPLLLISSDRDFFVSFRKAKPKNKIKEVLLSPKSIRTLAQTIAQHPDHLVVYHATGSVTAQKLATLSNDQKSRIFLVNGTYPGSIPQSDPYFLRLDQHTPDPQVAEWVSELLISGFTPQRLPATSEEPSEALEQSDSSDIESDTFN